MDKELIDDKITELEYTIYKAAHSIQNEFTWHGLAENLVNAGCGNINQALTEFAEALKRKVRSFGIFCNFITKTDIEETLKEFLKDGQRID